MNLDIPVLAIDGPGGAGKGTVSRAVARQLGWHFLDSGAIYRALAIAVIDQAVSRDAEDAITAIALEMNLHFEPGEPPAVCLNGADISSRLASEQTGAMASHIAAYAPVRKALLQKQRDFKKSPGLVADGRDMGSMVFPEARWKIFLTARVEVRAERRYKQLKQKGQDVNLDVLTRELEERDRRDRERTEAPLVLSP
ncbi:MAG: (d)CMP kinase, partial [Methylococcaceae bacterium]